MPDIGRYKSIVIRLQGMFDKCLVEQTTETCYSQVRNFHRKISQGNVKIRTTLIALLLGLLSSSRGRSLLLGRSCSSRGSSGVSLGVSNTVLELLDLRPAVLGLDGDGEDLLVRVDNGVHDGSQGGEVGGQGDGADGANGRLERAKELLFRDVKDAGAEGLAVVVDLSDAHTVGEGGDVEHVQQGGLRGSDLSARLNELQLSGNFNGTTSNLGRDTQSLEERGLVWWHTSVSGRDEDIERSNGTGTSGSSDSVGENLLTDSLQVTVGEDEADVALTIEQILSAYMPRQFDLVYCELTLDMRQQALILRILRDEALDGTANLKRI